MNRILAFLSFFMILCAAPAAEAAVFSICEGFKLEAPRPIRFNANEKKLICGDPNVNAWKEIPVFQAKFNIQNFLQDRGYFYPAFREEDGVVIVLPGEQTKVTALEVEGTLPASLRVTRRRHVKGRVLTPDLLNTIEGWANSELQINGYACPTVSVSADAATGVVTLTLEPGLLLDIAGVEEKPVQGLTEGVLRRFDAFAIGKPFSQLNLSLTSRRIEDDGIVQSSYFLTACQDDGVLLTQTSIAGKPRLISVGFGANTEEYAVGKVTWKHARLGALGSSIKVSAYGSYRRQEIGIESKWYFLQPPSRWHMNPRISFRREDQRPYELIAADARLTPAYTWDTDTYGASFSFGPKYSFTHTFRGTQLGSTHFLSVMAGILARSHDFEYYDNEPQSGFSVTGLVNLNSQKLLSDASAQQFQFTGEKLWNIGDFSPPLLVLGLRGAFATTIADRQSQSFNRIPPEYLYYLGGSQNLRGFKLNELPNADTGLLTSAFGSFEARLIKVLPFDIQPFFFGDVGVMGETSFEFDFPVYWSPGFGIRWPSPIGIFRTTIAHGFMIHNEDPQKDGLSHWQFYFSFGEEF